MAGVAGVLLYIGVFLLSTLIVAATIYIGTKVINEYIKFTGALIVALVGGVVESIFAWLLGGVIAWLLSIFAMLWALKKFSSTEKAWPDGILILVIAAIFRIGITILIVMISKM